MWATRENMQVSIVFKSVADAQAYFASVAKDPAADQVARIVYAATSLPCGVSAITFSVGG